MLYRLLLSVLLPLTFMDVAAQSTANLQSSSTWLTFQEAIDAAKLSERPILIDVYAPWCPWCAKLQTEVYPSEEIRLYIEENFEIARLNIEDKEHVIEFKGYTLTAAELASGLGAEATPTTVFLSAEGEYITRLPGYVEADEFIHVLKYIGSGAYQSEPFKEFRDRQ